MVRMFAAKSTATIEVTRTWLNANSVVSRAQYSD